MIGRGCDVNMAIPTRGLVLIDHPQHGRSPFAAAHFPETPPVEARPGGEEGGRKPCCPARCSGGPSVQPRPHLRLSPERPLFFVPILVVSVRPGPTRVRHSLIQTDTRRSLTALVVDDKLCSPRSRSLLFCYALTPTRPPRTTPASTAPDRVSPSSDTRPSHNDRHTRDTPPPP